MTTNIYVLKLSNNKWYIGKTDDVSARYKQHMKGYGSAWTKKYIPISLEKTVADASHFDEDKITKQYMAKYGIDNVRGGSYCNVDLDDSQIEFLKREIWGAQDKCARCGRSGHFQKDCYARTDVDGNEFVVEEIWSCEHCEDEFDNYDECAKHEKHCGKSIITCFRCGREGHYSTTCYAKKHVNGYYIR